MYKFIIVGAGIAGIDSDKQILERDPGAKVVILEKEDRAGGKIKTYQKGGLSEYGAMVLSANYPSEFLTFARENNIEFQPHLDVLPSEIPLSKEFSAKNFIGKMCFAVNFLIQLMNYEKLVFRYKNLQHTDSLIQDLDTPFYSTATKFNFKKVAKAIEFFLAPYGYGDIRYCPTGRVLAYMGYTTILTILTGMVSSKRGLTEPKKGFEYFIKTMLNQLQKKDNFELKTSATITSIVRDNEDRVVVHFNENINNAVKHKKASGKHLILAIPPLRWQKLGMPLTLSERTVIENLTYYVYPVAICKIRGLDNKTHYYYEAFKKDYSNHVAFISSKDGRDDTADRLCTVYINVPPSSKNKELHLTESEIKNIIHKDLDSKFESVEIIDIRVWEDYFCCVPYRVAMDFDASGHPKTTYITPALSYGKRLGFELVGCVIEMVTAKIDKLCKVQNKSYLAGIHSFFSTVRNVWYFYEERNQTRVDAKPPPKNDSINPTYNCTIV